MYKILGYGGKRVEREREEVRMGMLFQRSV